MSETPSIATIVDLLREILYDILGLFLPGAAFLLILRHSSIWVLHNLAESLSKGQNTTQVAIFIGASYVVGYAIQGVSGTIWIPIIKLTGKPKTLAGRISALLKKTVKLYGEGKNWYGQSPTGDPPFRKKLGVKLEGKWKNLKTKAKNWFNPSESGAAGTGIQGIAPAGLQTQRDIENSELFRALKVQLSKYCDLQVTDVKFNEVQNLAFSVAGDRSANAFRFSFRADLCAGMFVVFLLGAVVTIIEYWRAQVDQRRLLFTALIYVFLSMAFYLRAKFYYNIRGRIVYTIALAVLAELRQNKEDSKEHERTSTINVIFPDSHS